MIERPAARYGRQPLSRRTRRLVAAGMTLFIVVLGVGVALLGFQRLGPGDLQGTLNSYNVLDDRTVEVTIKVTRNEPSKPVVCIVRGKSLDGSESGRREILVPPSDGTAVLVTTLVKTSRPPVVGDIYGCGTDVPAYLRAP